MNFLSAFLPLGFTSFTADLPDLPKKIENWLLALNIDYLQPWQLRTVEKEGFLFLF